MTDIVRTTREIVSRNEINDLLLYQQKPSRRVCG
jgi:hypothetical protein